MSVLRAQLVFPGATNLAKDQVVNTLHFGTSPAADDVAQAALIATAIANAWNSVDPASGSNLIHFISRDVKTQDAHVKFTRLNDAPPRVPIADIALGFAANNNPSLPGEVSIVASFQAQRVSGTNQAHRRGRIYVGPLTQDTMTATAPCRAHSNLLSCVNHAMAQLKASSDAAPDWGWVVFSQALGLNNTAPVDNGWCDDAFDTQRRRGAMATLRSTW